MCWFQAETSQKINGVALVVHGLNLKPDKMEPIIAQLTNAGIDVLNLSLRGHGRNYSHGRNKTRRKARIESFKTVSHSLWMDETRQAYHQARRQSDQQGAPLFFIGYSLGGLMGADLLASYTDVRFDRMVLFAPALSLYATHFFMKLLSPFPRIVIPNPLIKTYRANYGTPVAAYTSLFEALDHFKKNASPRLNIPILVFIDRQDELVSYRGLKRFIEKERLDQWRFHPIQKGKNGVEEKMRHLIIDEPSMGKETWHEMGRAMMKHLLHES
ncbi:alpha/beta fold hydrolase [Thermodesulfobacteriota bacterium]